MYAYALIVFCLATVKFCESERNIFSKLRFDVGKVGRDLENLVFDIVKKTVVDVGLDGLNDDYYGNNDDNWLDEVTTQHTVSKETLNKLLENTTEVSTTAKSEDRQNVTQNSTEEILEDIFQKRSKRSLNETSSVPILQNNSLNDSPIVNTTSLCSEKSQEERILELQNMENLKEEIKKLHDLVILLRDQQKILSILDKNSNKFDNDITSRFDTKDLLKVIDYINTRNMQEARAHDFGRTDEDSRGKISTFDELANIKSQLRDTVQALNKTKEVLMKERKKGLLLEKELSDQRLDLNFLKMMVKKLYKTDTSLFNRENVDDILGASPLLPNNSQRGKQLDEDTEERNEENGKLQLKNRDLASLERVLNRLKKPKTESSSRLMELENEIEKKKQEQNVLKQLKDLEKRLEQGHQKSKISSDTESELLKKLENMIGGAESRSLDEDIELELHKLQEAIDDLRPNEALDPDNETPQNQKEDEEIKEFQSVFNRLLDRGDDRKTEDDRKFQMMFNQMFNRQSKKENDSIEQFQTMLETMDKRGKKNRNRISPEVRVNGLLLKEIVKLRQQLASIENSKMNNGDFYSTSDGYVPQIMSDVYGKPPGAMHKPAYRPYMNAIDQNTMSEFYRENIHSRPNNQQYSEYISPQKYFSRKFDQQRFVAPSYPENSKFEKPNWSNFENEEKNMHQMHYDEPNNIPIFEENTYEKNFLEPHQMSHVLPPGEKQYEDPYQRTRTVNDQDFFHQDKNKFFLDISRPIPETFYHPQGPPGGSENEPTVNPPQAADNGLYIYQKVEDLKTQIYNLQNIINGLRNPNYTQTPKDREVIAGLENQISDLKGAIDNINPDIVPPRVLPNSSQPYPSDQNQQNYPNKPRKRRSLEENNEPSDSQMFDHVVSGLKQMIFDKDNGDDEPTKINNFQEIQKRIDDIKNQLETGISSRDGQSWRNSPVVSYQPPYYQNQKVVSTPFKKDQIGIFKSNIKNDIFTSIVIKILDKIIGATPAVLERLFGHGLGQLINFGDYSDDYKVDYRGPSDVQKLFKSLGFFGYGPLIILKLIDGFTTFVNILKKNAFFRNFLIPALVLLIVGGAIVFLIWWLQPDQQNFDIGSAFQSRFYHRGSGQEKYAPEYNFQPHNYYRVNDRYGRKYLNSNDPSKYYDHSYNSYGTGESYNSYGTGESYRS